LLHEHGPARIASYLEELTDHLCERVQSKRYEIVSSRAAGEKSQIVCIRHPKRLSVTALYGLLKGKNIITAPRGDRLRIAPHLYNTLEEIDQFVEALP
jgi:selenocysteine lyase/cysteine desulfurase